MKKVFGVALGILAAIGGFVDIGDIVFNVAAGAEFGYELLWAVVLGVGGIITYAEMCGRVAAVSKKAVFDVVRERLGLSVGLVALVAGQFVNLMTLTAEIGGVALVLQLIAGLPYHALLVLAFVGLALVLWLMPFGWIERVFGYCGLALLVFVVAAIKLNPDWGSVATVSSRPRGRERLGLRVLRGRARRGGDDPVRGLLLLLRARSRSGGGRRTSGSTARTRSSATRSAGPSRSR